MHLSRLTPALLLASASLLGLSAHAQGLCTLVPAATVKATLGLSGNLTAKPNGQGSNGCDYALDISGPKTVSANVITYAGLYKTILDQRMNSIDASAKLSGIGDKAYYLEKGGQQSLVILAKGKVVSFIIKTGKGVPKQAVLALGRLTIAKPIDTLRDGQ